MFDARGSMFTIEPFEKYFSIEYADSLTNESASAMLHMQLRKWGKIERENHPPQTREVILEDGKKVNIPHFHDPELEWSRKFIIGSFYNICCLGSHQLSIEELIFLANTYRKSIDAAEESKDAFCKLLGISRAFLLAEWAKNIFHKAISNDDDELFKKISRWINENTPIKRFDTARTWLGTTLLWYLGGKDIKPRREFMLFLREKGILSIHMEEDSFNAMLSNLKLSKDFNITK
jgi:hypothetical protein